MIKYTKLLLLSILIATSYNIKTSVLIEDPVMSLAGESSLKENTIIINNNTNEKLAFRYFLVNGQEEILILFGKSIKIIDKKDIDFNKNFIIDLVKAYKDNSTFKNAFENAKDYLFNSMGSYQLVINPIKAQNNGIINIDIDPKMISDNLNININYFGNDLIRKLKTIDDTLNKQGNIPYLKAQSYLKPFINKVKNFYKGQNILAQEKIIENILKGALFYYDIYNSSQELLVTEHNKKKLEEDVSNFIWFCFALAINKKQEFEEGTFLISDPNLDLYKFLAKLGHYRSSSHFKSYSKVTGKEYAVSSQMGLDLTNLPAGKGTILFGKINEDNKNPKFDFMFIKPENYGVNWFSFPLHAQEYLFAQLRKHLPTAINPLGTDDEEYYRKERIPADVANAYSEIIRKIEKLGMAQNTNFGIDFQDNLKKAHGLGISFIYSQLPILLKIEQLSDDIKTELNVLRDLLGNANLEYDNLELRFGREVILTQADFEPFRNQNNMVFFISGLLEQLKNTK